MITIDQELAPEEAASITLIGLRGIRDYFIENDVGQGNEPTASLCQEPLKDAEALGLTGAAYAIDATTKKDVGEQRERWLNCVTALSDKYDMPHVIRRRLTDLRIGAYLGFIPGLIPEVAEDYATPEALQLVERYVLRKNMAKFSVSDLNNPSLLILSPLSTDYLIMCLLQRAIQHTYSTFFRLKPLILSHKPFRKTDGIYRPLAIPDNQDESLTDITQVEVFVESPSYLGSETMNIAKRAASLFRPNP